MIASTLPLLKAGVIGVAIPLMWLGVFVLDWWLEDREISARLEAATDERRGGGTLVRRADRTPIVTRSQVLSDAEAEEMHRLWLDAYRKNPPMRIINPKKAEPHS